MLNDYASEVTAIADLERATWNLRDVLLARQGMTPEVVRLEDAALHLGEALATLRSVLQGGPAGR